MRKTFVWAILAAMCLTLFATIVAAQTHDQDGPPKVLIITREEVKPGKGEIHNQHEAAWTQALIKANWNTPMLAITSVTGANEDWFLIGYDSFAAMEKDTKTLEKNAAASAVMSQYGAKETDFVSETRTITARYRPELSYRPDFKLGDYKYFSVNTIRFRLGEDSKHVFEVLNGAREKANFDAHVLIYQVNSGMPAGTYVTFTPLKDLSTWDMPPNEALDAALKEAKWSELVGKALMTVESRLFSFNPKLSHVPESVASLDPEFWNPKPVAAKAVTTKKATPAAKKETKTEKK